MGIAMKIMKLFWQQRQDGAYAIVDMKGLDLLGPERSGQDFFAVRDDIVLTQIPPIGGTIRSVLGESIVACETPRCCASSQSCLSQSSKSASARTALLNTTRRSAAAAIETGVRGVIQGMIFT